MKRELVTNVKAVLRDRWIMGLLIANIIFAIVVVVVLAFHIQPRETKVITQYSAFGITGLYRNYWYTLWFYAILEIVSVVGYGLLAVKLVKLDRRQLGISLLWASIGLSFIVILLSLPVLRIASLG